VLLQRVQKQRPGVQPDWRYFSLTQVNDKREGWTAWEAPDEEPVKGRLAFKAAEAARRQGGFDLLHFRLLEARHGQKRDLDDRSVVLEIAGSAGLDVERFERDLADPSLLLTLARDHTLAVADHGVFGTPTFVFADGGTAYVRVRPAPDGAEALRLFDELVAVIASEPSLLEIKRPASPRPNLA